MITLAHRVTHAIDAVARGEYEFALEDAAVAIDISAQRVAAANRSSKANYKEFLERQFWLVELMALNGIAIPESVFGNVEVSGIKGPAKFSDIIYHLVRCGLVHSTGLPASVRFEDCRGVFLADNLIVLPSQVLWGLLAAVVFAPTNAGEQSEGDYFLECAGHRFRIADSWGKEDLIRPLYEAEVRTRVPLLIPRLGQNET